MSRIYWDKMVFAYWLEDRAPYSDRIDFIHSRMLERGDTLVASSYSVAELLVAPAKLGDQKLEKTIRKFFESGRVEVQNFDIAVAARFAEIRATANVTPADAIHLACAATAGVDLFLTNDKSLRKLVIRGIPFIDGIDTSVLDP